MEQALIVVQTASNATWVLLAVVAVRVAVGHRGTAAKYVAGTFLSAGVVVFFSYVFGEAPGVWAVKILILAMLAIPVLLHRFVATMDGGGRALRRALDAAALALALVTLTWTSIPREGEVPSGAWAVYTVAFLSLWAVLTARTGIRLWRASNGQPSVVRVRLRLLAAGALGLGVTILIPSAARGNELFAIIGALAGVASGVLFLVGFAPPKPLRAWWREPEEAALLLATRELMLADGPDQIAEILLPAMTGLLGATGSALVDSRGRVAGTHGVVPADVTDALANKGDELLVIAVAGRQNVLLWTSPYSPMFGEDERRLVAGLAVLSDLALDRVHLLESERRARREAEEAEQEVEALVATISHDLRNPLTVIGGMADLLGGALREDLSPEAQNFVDRIQANSRYMAGLVNDILAIADLRGGSGLEVDVDLAAMLRDIRFDVLVGAPQAKVLLGELPVLRGDPTRLRRVFDNLLGNAVSHAGPLVEVTIDCLEDSDPAWFQLAIRDNGPGVRPEDAQRVFGLFQRGTNREGGSGLGLAICRRTIEAMGGSVWFANPTSGADLRIRLPKALVVGGDVGDVPASRAELREGQPVIVTG